MVIEVLLCDLGSLVSEGHLLFPKARTPRTPRFIYATQDPAMDGASPSGPPHIITSYEHLKHHPDPI